MDLNHFVIKIFISILTNLQFTIFTFQAALLSLTENLQASTVGMNHFRSALNIVKPSLTAEILQSYTELGGKSTTTVLKSKIGSG